jgi:hypothetical protein
MRVLVCGGRDFNDRDKLFGYLDQFCLDHNLKTEEDEYGNWRFSNIHIIHGGARGADSLADQWAIVNWVPWTEFKADWDKHGKAAGPTRNKQMLDEGKPDVVIAFPGGKGTAHMVSIARAAGVKVIEVN